MNLKKRHNTPSLISALETKILCLQWHRNAAAIRSLKVTIHDSNSNSPPDLHQQKKEHHGFRLWQTSLKLLFCLIHHVIVSWHRLSVSAVVLIPSSSSSSCDSSRSASSPRHSPVTVGDVCQAARDMVHFDGLTNFIVKFESFESGCGWAQRERECGG